MVSYAMSSECTMVMTIHLRFPALPQTEISLDSLNLFTILCMVVGKRPKFFMIEKFDFFRFKVRCSLITNLLAYCGMFQNSLPWIF